MNSPSVVRAVWDMQAAGHIPPGDVARQNAIEALGGAEVRAQAGPSVVKWVTPPRPHLAAAPRTPAAPTPTVRADEGTGLFEFDDEPIVSATSAAKDARRTGVAADVDRAIAEEGTGLFTHGDPSVGDEALGVEADAGTGLFAFDDDGEE